MPIYVVKTGSETLRVRQEEFGCTVWSRDKYAEGDETTLESISLPSLITEAAVSSHELSIPKTSIFDPT